MTPYRCTPPPTHTHTNDQEAADTHSMPRPCRSLIHTCHAAPLPCSDSAVSFVKVRVVAGDTRTVVQQFIRSSFSCRVLLPLLTVVGTDRCEEDVIIAGGLYLLVEEEKRKNENTGFIRCSEQEKRKENFRLCLDVWKMTGKNFSNILEWVFRNLKTWNSCCTQTLKRRIQDGDGA